MQEQVYCGTGTATLSTLSHTPVLVTRIGLVITGMQEQVLRNRYCRKYLSTMHAGAYFEVALKIFY